MKQIRPFEKGLKKFFGELEAKVMETVWERGSVSVRDVYTTLKKRRKVAYTTILTVMSRLYNKGLLRRFKEGRGYLYEPSVRKNEFVDNLNREVMSSLFKDFREPTISHFVDIIESEAPETLERLYRLLEERFKGNED